ncbi:MAG: hypothetical protein JEY91_09750 [Spirochaetaceae bacterium]|nr:hypothetical protein [Spirochaetaceae bacterium]
MKRKITVSILLILLTCTNLFALKDYSNTTGDDDGRLEYKKEMKVQPKLEVEIELGTIWGLDLNQMSSGFDEIIDLDLRYTLNPFSKLRSGTEGLDLDAPYGMVMVDGVHVEFNIVDQEGDQRAAFSAPDTTKNISINYENIYGKIVWDPFYLLVGSSDDGNHYDRINGWTFIKSTSKIRSNLAHLGYRVPFVTANSSSRWAQEDKTDWLENEAADSMLGFGFGMGATEMMLSIGSKQNWEKNTENRYDIGYMIESNPIGDLTVKGSVNTGINYVAIPLDFAVSAGYRFDLGTINTSSLSLVPYFAMDGHFISGLPMADNYAKDWPFEELAAEISLGVTLEWGGPVGWGYEPLNNIMTDRGPGITLSASLFNPGYKFARDENPEGELTIAISVFEDTNGGLIPNLGFSGVFEIADVTNVAETTDDLNTNINEEIKIQYGLYVDYNILDILKPYTRFSKTSLYGPVNFELGTQFTLIPNTVITVSYENEAINGLFDDNYKEEPDETKYQEKQKDKGLIAIEFKVVL